MPPQTWLRPPLPWPSIFPLWQVKQLKLCLNVSIVELASFVVPTTLPPVGPFPSLVHVEPIMIYFDRTSAAGIWLRMLRLIEMTFVLLSVAAPSVASVPQGLLRVTSPGPMVCPWTATMSPLPAAFIRKVRRAVEAPELENSHGPLPSAGLVASGPAAVL